MPQTGVLQGKHKLIIEGLINGIQGNEMFRNETVVSFDPKYVSLFIQTDFPFYYAEQTGVK